MNDLSFHESPDKSQISYFLQCDYIDLVIPVAIPVAITRVRQAVQSCPESPALMKNIIRKLYYYYKNIINIKY